MLFICYRITGLQYLWQKTLQQTGNKWVTGKTVAYARDKQKITIADTLEGSRVADFVEKRIREALGQNESSSTDNVELVIS